MLAEIDSGLLTEWMAFYLLEPFGFEAQMYGHGITSAVLTNMFKEKSDIAVQPTEFIPETWSDTEEDDVGERLIQELKERFKRR